VTPVVSLDHFKDFCIYDFVHRLNVALGSQPWPAQQFWRGAHPPLPTSKMTNETHTSVILTARLSAERHVLAVRLATASSHRHQLVVLPRVMKSFQHRDPLSELAVWTLLELGEQLHADRQRTVALVSKQFGQ